MILVQVQQDILSQILGFLLDNIVTFVLGLAASLLFFLIRPKASFWFAKQKVRIFRGAMIVNLDSLVVFDIDEIEEENPLEKIKKQFMTNPNFDSDVLKSSQGITLEVVARLPHDTSRFEGKLSVDDETEEAYAIKFHSEKSVSYSNIDNHVESLFTLRDMIHEELIKTRLISGSLSGVTIGLSWKFNQIKLLSWLNYEHELDGFVYIPEMDLKITYGPGRATVTSAKFQSYIKEVIQNLVVESTIN